MKGYWKRFILIFIAVFAIIKFSQGFMIGFTHDKSIVSPNDPLNWLSVEVAIALGIAYLSRYLW